MKHLESCLEKISDFLLQKVREEVSFDVKFDVRHKKRFFFFFEMKITISGFIDLHSGSKTSEEGTLDFWQKLS